jgi:hypothetical protein
MTNCWPPPGTVGLAYVGALCAGRGYNTGVSTLSRVTWLTVAHELGHNFGSPHSFDNGQGATGGIMDYGDGTTNGARGQTDGVSQFNLLRENDICGHINSRNQGDTTCWAASNTPTPPPTTMPTAPPTTKTCTGTIDQYEHCLMWQKLDYCNIESMWSWMSQNCPQTCCGANSVVSTCPTIEGCSECPGGLCQSCSNSKAVSPRKDKCVKSVGLLSADEDGAMKFEPGHFLFLRAHVEDTAVDTELAVGTLGAHPFSWRVTGGAAVVTIGNFHHKAFDLPAGSVDLGVSTLGNMVEQDIDFEKVPGLIFTDTDHNGESLAGSTLVLTSSFPSLSLYSVLP